MNLVELEHFSNIGELASSRLLERTRRLSNEFNAPSDTVIFYEGIRRSVRLLNELFVGEPVRLLDIGCNSGIPDMTGIRQGIIQSSLGIEVSTEAVIKGERIKHMLGLSNDQMRFLNLSMLDNSCRSVVESFKPQLIAGNLPYLPALPDSPIEVSGGVDGTQYVPRVILDYASLVGAPVATMNLCSLVDLRKVIDQVEKSSYSIYEVLLLSHPFGEYTQRLYREGVLGRVSYKPYYFADLERQTQLVMNMILVEKKWGDGRNLDHDVFFEAMESYAESSVFINDKKL